MVRYFGSPASAPPAGPSILTITDPPEGAWPTLGGAPFSFNGYSYMGYPDNTGLFRVAVYNETTGVTTLSTVGTSSIAPDQHNKPALRRRSSDDKLVTVFCEHDSPNVFVRVSTNPLTSDPILSGGWAAATNIAAQLGGGTHTYPALFEFGTDILLFDRAKSGGISYWKTYLHAVDTGTLATGWAIGINLVSDVRAYGLACQPSSTRLDFFVTDGSYASDYASLYHFYRDGTTYRNSAGTDIGTPPFTYAELTKVYDGATAGIRAPGDCLNDGTDIAVVFGVHTGALVGSGIKATDEDYLYCRATVGSASWSNRTVATAIGGLTEAYEEGSLAIDTADIDHLIVSRRASSSIALPFHMYDYLTADAGATWAEEIVSGSGDPDMYPWFIRGYTSALEYVWLKGRFTTQNDFDNGIQGWGVAP